MIRSDSPVESDDPDQQAGASSSLATLTPPPEVAMPRALKPCSKPGCPALVPKGQGRCDACTRTADRARGTAAQRGYDARHRERFRAAVLARHPICKACMAEPSAHADHWPLDRDELVRRGMDPNDPTHGRGLCHGCHSRHTAHAQPGGWNR